MLKKNQLVTSTVALMIITLVVKLLGYIEKVVLAYYYGTSAEVDVFLLITTIILSFFILFRELIEPGFLVVFLKIQTKDYNKSWSFFNKIALYLFILVVLFFILGSFFSKEIIDFFAPGFTASKKLLGLDIFRIAFPAVIFLCMSNLTSITLNSQKVFVLPAVGDIIYKSGIIVFLVLLFPYYGIKGAAWGVFLGAIGKLIIHLVGLRKKVRLKLEKIDATYYKDMWVLTWPLLIGILFSQSSSFVDNIYASYFNDGSIAALSYSKKIVEMPILVFPYVLSIVVFPYFSKLYIEKDMKRLTNLFYNSLGWIVFIFLPLSVLFYKFSYPVIEVLLQRGAFNEASTLLTSKPMMVYSFGMTVFAIETVTVLLFFSLSDTKTPIFVGIICVIINILITISLISYIGYLAIPVALVFSKTLKMIILFLFLKRRKIMSFNPHFLFKVTLATAVLYVYISAIQFLEINISFFNRGSTILVVLFYFVSGSIVYLLTCFLLNMKKDLKKTIPSN